MQRRFGVVKSGVFALVRVTSLLLAGEGICRVKYFIDHNYNWNYLTAPFRGAEADVDPVASVGDDGSSQVQIPWHPWCRDRDVFSTHYQRLMPYTYDDYCFRGDRIARAKSADEFRVFVLGDSTIEDQEPDGDTAVDYLKRALAESYDSRRVVMVNAGHRTYGSTKIVALYDDQVSGFNPDLVIYSEAWNEQVDFSQWGQVTDRIADFGGTLHRALYYNSLLYTYLLEEYYFSTLDDVRFWQIDLDRLSNNFLSLARNVQVSGATFVFVTQPTRFPRHHRGIDTFDFDQVSQFLDSLQRDRTYVYDTYEISALNQRLAVARQLQLARSAAIPVVNVLSEVEAVGQERREEMFYDLAHRTWRGNQFIGELIGTKLRVMMAPDGTIHANPGTQPRPN